MKKLLKPRQMLSNISFVTAVASVESRLDRSRSILQHHAFSLERLALFRLGPQVAARVEEDEDVDRDDDGRELEHAEVHLVSADAAHQALGSLGQTEDCTHVYGNGGDHGGQGEALVDFAGSVTAAPDKEAED